MPPLKKIPVEIVMTFVPQGNGQGALFELVARGQKDTFFLLKV
jgi:hypothetical protein